MPPNSKDTSGGSTYRQIFKATSIVGGAQVVTILIGIVRSKAMALLLGPSGIGLAGTFLTVNGMIGGVTELGLGQSGVRQIAEASGTGDQERIARTAATLTKVTFLSGLLGLILGLALALPLSHLTFGDSSRTYELSLLAVTLLVGSVSAGQWALLQGLRRLGDLAKSQIWGAFWGALGSIGIIFVWREQGIAPYLVVNALIALWFSRWYARKVPIERVRLTWHEAWVESRPMLALGSAFVLQNLMLGGSGYLSRLLIINELGLAAVGLFTASYTLSTYYVQLILKAMGTDFYPRLTAVANDHTTVNRMVNEQIEMGVLMAVPGVLGILTLAPWCLKILYSQDFMAATVVIRWMVLGVFVQVITWPVGTIILAKNRKRLFIASQILTSILGLGFLAIALPYQGLEGVGTAQAAATLVYGILIILLVSPITNFRFSRRTSGVILLSVLAIALVFGVAYKLPTTYSLPIGLSVTILAVVLSAVCLKSILKIDIFKEVRSRFGS